MGRVTSRDDDLLEKHLAEHRWVRWKGIHDLPPIFDELLPEILRRVQNGEPEEGFYQVRMDGVMNVVLGTDPYDAVAVDFYRIYSYDAVAVDSSLVSRVLQRIQKWMRRRSG